MFQLAHRAEKLAYSPHANLNSASGQTRMFVILFLVRDASARLPRGILQGNLVDLGNFHQCLNINEGADNMHIKGKYCMTRVLADDNSQMLNFLSDWPSGDINKRIDKMTTDRVKEYLKLERSFRPIFGMPERNIR